MVAYSFNKRFAEPIATGHPATGIIKRQTIRAPRKRHAQPGELLQIYQGMRTTQCRKIIQDPVCVAVRPIELFVALGYVRFTDTGEAFGITWMLDDFARQDGFLHWADLQAFWQATHPEASDKDMMFPGVLIRWEPSR
ncbi:MAG: ASCH domain-containing protein [Proteobacteria bacterium]|nr:ASCH domain-containing protein [Pseudomonadota bacterium]